jgi:hypothetical protein
VSWRGTTLLYDWGKGATVLLAPETLNGLKYHMRLNLQILQLIETFDSLKYLNIYYRHKMIDILTVHLIPYHCSDNKKKYINGG